MVATPQDRSMLGFGAWAFWEIGDRAGFQVEDSVFWPFTGALRFRDLLVVSD